MLGIIRKEDISEEQKQEMIEAKKAQDSNK